jgi:ATP phosphoribosyltransferase regulatory subunit
MALQPAAGARDLNPQQVEHNHRLRERLAAVYRRWGYEEVAPPRVERLDTLKAGGGIASEEIVRLVADEPLGLRPEMTASIARAASTRFAKRSRPLRLWASGTVFENHQADEGRQCIEEKLHSGVELFGANAISAELELLTLLMDALASLDLQGDPQVRLLLGHADLMTLILAPFRGPERDAIRIALMRYDRLSLEAMDLDATTMERLTRLMDLRGEPNTVLETLRRLFGPQPSLSELERLFEHLMPLAQDQGVILQLDPSFQSHYGLYDGLVFQLICQGQSAPVVVARGGRYDALVKRFGASGGDGAGVGFSFCLDDIRDLPSSLAASAPSERRVLVCHGPNQRLEEAITEQRRLHGQGRQAELALDPCTDRTQAEQRQRDRQCDDLVWLGA